MQFSAQQGALCARPRAFTFSSRPHSNRIIGRACRIGAFKEFSSARHDSFGGRSVFSSSRARSNQNRWQIAAGPPSFPEPDSGAYVGVKETQPAQPEDAALGLSSNGAKPSNGAAVSGLPANGAASSAAAVPAAEKGGLAHRWRIVFMMAVAFVLCNMDKVSAGGTRCPVQQ